MITPGIIQGIAAAIFKSIWENKDEAYKLLSHRVNQVIFYASEAYKENFISRHGFIRQEELKPSMCLNELYINPLFIDQVELKHPTNKPLAPYQELDYISELQLNCNGFELSQNYPLLILKGEPGIGKTTFLKKLGLSVLGDESLSKVLDGYIPVFIQISQYLDEEFDLKAIINKEFESCGFPEHDEFVHSALKKGKFLILIDGIDSGSTDWQDQILVKIKNFSDNYSLNRFILTCRKSKKTHMLSRFHEALLLGFGSQQAKKYIRTVFKDKNLSEQKVLEIWKLLIETSQATKNIVHNPFSLGIALALYKSDESRILGQTVLYEKILFNLISTDFLLAQNNCKKDSFDTRLKVFSEIAYICLKSGRSQFRSIEIYRLYTTILERLEVEDAFSDIENFKEDKIFDFIEVDGSDSCHFINPLIQKILVAHYLMDNIKTMDEAVDLFFYSKKWKDVFIFLSGMQGDHYLLKNAEIKLNECLCRGSLIEFMGLVCQSSESVNVSANLTVNRCYTAFVIMEVTLLFGSRNYEQKLISSILKKISDIIDLLELSPYSFFPLNSIDSGKSQLSFRNFIDPKILRGLSLERLFDLALILSHKAKEYQIFNEKDSKVLTSVIARLKDQLKGKTISPYYREVCEKNLYRLWLSAFGLKDKSLHFTVDELQALSLYFQSISLILCCAKESFYISGRSTNNLEHLAFQSLDCLRSSHLS